MKKLNIAPKLSLPTDAATSTIVVYGGKGMGKTNLANVLVEELAAAGLHFAVIDPMGVWWGLRHGASGRGRGIKVLILGGIHGDLPITPESGALVADLVVDEDASVIIDISRRADGSMWAISERVRFVRDYAKRLYQRQGERRRPIHQVIDEAARFAPQIVRHGEGDVAACMGAIAVLVEEGRNVGIGVTLVTQRSARLNKDVAELADCMIAFRIVGPNSMRAVLDWLGEHVEKSRLKEIGEQLRSLPRGSALVVSPGWLEFEGIVAMRKRRTFDSSKTPEAGAEVNATGTGAKVDLSKYRKRLATLIEQQAENDPKQLRAKITELIKERDQLSRAVNAPRKETTVHKEIIVEKQVVNKAAVVALERSIDGFDKRMAKVIDAATHASEPMQAAVAKFVGAAHQVVVAISKLTEQLAIAKGQAPPKRGHNGHRPIERKVNGDGTQTWKPAALPTPKPTKPPKPPRAPRQDQADGTLPIGEMRILCAVVTFSGAQREQITVLTGYTRSSRNSYLQRLGSRGMIATDANGLVVATPDGIAHVDDLLAAGEAPQILTGHELRQHYITKLPTGEGKLLDLIIAQRDGVDRDDLSAATGYTRSSRNSYLQRLKSKELIRKSGAATVIPSPYLFELP